MRSRSILLLFACIFLFACSSTKKTTQTTTTTQSTGTTQATPASTSKTTEDGLSYATAVVITEKSEGAGVAAEYKWIREHYSDYKIKGQSLRNYNGKPYDVMSLVFSDGKTLDLYFDISNFFGKF